MYLIHTNFERQCSENACGEVESSFILREPTWSCLKQFPVNVFTNLNLFDSVRSHKNIADIGPNQYSGERNEL